MWGFRGLRVGAVGILWTLAAACGGGGGHASATPASRITVLGHVVTERSRPAPFVPVLIDDLPPVLTDDQGAFAISGVTPPYTATVFATLATTTYVGLTRSDPTLVRRTFERPNHATVAGTIGGGTGYPEPSDHRSWMAGCMAYGVTLLTSINPATGAYSLPSMDWDGPDATQVRILACQCQTGVDMLPATFTGFGSLTVDLTDGDNLTGYDFDLSPVGTAGVSGTYTLPAGYSLVTKSPVVMVDQHDRLYLQGDVNDDGAMAFNVPEIPGATYGAEVVGVSPEGGTTTVRTRRSPANVANLTFALDLAIQRILPQDHATGVDESTTFFVDARDQAVYRFSFQGGNGEPSIYVITDDPETTIPAFGPYGLPLPPLATYDWYVTSYAPFADIDEAAGPDTLAAPDVVSETRTALADFTTAP